MISVLGAYYELNKRYDAIHYFYVNAAQGVYKGIDWFQAFKDVIKNPLDAVTYPKFNIQKVGVKSEDDLGLVFQANVFGPYYLLNKLKPLLSNGNAVVVWISSLLSDPKYLSLEDIQLSKTTASYEGSKRLVDLLHLATYKELKDSGIRQYLTQPGIFTSFSFFQFLNFFTFYSMLALFYMARLMGSNYHNIDGYKAANAPVYVATQPSSVVENQALKYGSATRMRGQEYIETTEVDPTGTYDVKKYIENLVLEWDEKLKDQITNTRTPF
ncbi:HBR043Wp [Eremothecium sinecaudum]|uniref:3beta-hydroxysteroid 3-dehydrogenase n=1 Tax=Eremothecium sinecaudum TaxID=45286 RepID=A0A120K123_9SACH|nr:HBR043Wp [Eremothecium sinecaudum]AMD18944.1 HBR043Wp [Eremothecium sinecaudum]